MPEKNETKKNETKKCNLECEVYSRVVGYYRPVKNWNKGKKQEFDERKEYKPNYKTKLDEKK